MIEFYPEIRQVHIAAALASGSLFLLRGLAAFAGVPRPLASLLRYLAYTADTVLLTVALMLMTIIQQYPFVHHWLTVKVILLVVYVALGVLAFSVARRQGRRLAFWLAGMAVFGFIYSVARAHHPLGFLLRLTG